jgi:hypothetical protein
LQQLRTSDAVILRNHLKTLNNHKRLWLQEWLENVC